MIGLRALVVGTSAVLLTGCVEVDGVLEVKPDGSAVNRVELRLETKHVREMDAAAAQARRKQPPPPAEETKSFADICAAATDPAETSKQEPKLPNVPTSSAVQVRGKWTICVITEAIADPARHYSEIATQLGLADDKFERLPGESSYRYVSAVAMNRVLSAMKLSEEDRTSLGTLRTAIPANAKLTFTIKSERISDADGKLAANAKSVRWSFPLQRLLDTSTAAPPLRTRALIHYR